MTILNWTSVQWLMGLVALCLLLSLAACDTVENEIEDRGIPVVDVTIPI